MTMPLRMAVLSDIHAVKDGRAGEVLVRTNAVGTSPLDEPFGALANLVKSDPTIECDVVCCLGDIGSFAEPSAINYGWQKVQDVARLLTNGRLLATTGNHDVDSRRVHHPHDPYQTLKFGLPEYPVASELSAFKYWAKNYFIEEFPERSAQVIVLNTSSLHYDESASRNGTVSTSTIGALRAEIDSRPAFETNILICHHHPYKHGDVDSTDYSAIDNAPELVNLLCDRSEVWTVVHGHKHRPRVGYGPGPGTSPVVFSAGSFSGPLYPLVRDVENQFYLLEFDPRRAAELNLDVAVRFRSWSFRIGQGWVEADGAGLPRLGGVGSRHGIASWTAMVRLAVNGHPYRTWAEIVAEQPTLEFVTPSDLAQVAERLKRENYGVEMKGGGIWQVAKK